MNYAPDEIAYYTHEIWSVLQALEITEHAGDISDKEAIFDDQNLLEVTAEVETGVLGKLVHEKTQYLEAAHTDKEVTNEMVLNKIVEDINNGINIIFNRPSKGRPETGLYRKTGSGQWEKVDESHIYPQYKDLLWDLTEENYRPDVVPTVPSLRKEFLQAISTSDAHELPPDGAVNEILTLHVDSIRAEREARDAVSTLKRKLEKKGVDPRTASSVATDMEPYLKPDSELDEE